MTLSYAALVPIMPIPPIRCGSSYGIRSLPLTEWINSASSRSDRARSSSTAPWQPTPHMIRTWSARSILSAISSMSSSLATRSERRSPDARRAAPAPARRLSPYKATRRGTTDRPRSTGCSRCRAACAACRPTGPEQARGRARLRGLIGAGHHMGAAGVGGSCADGEPSCELGLTGGGQRRPLSSWRTPTRSDEAAPIASARGFSEIADETEDMLTPICSSVPISISATVRAIRAS